LGSEEKEVPLGQGQLRLRGREIDRKTMTRRAKVLWERK
jgi:hypothetical protein